MVTRNLPVILNKYFDDSDVDLMLSYIKKVYRPSPDVPNITGAFGFESSAEADKISHGHPIVPLTGDPGDDASILKITECILAVKKEMESFFGVEMSFTNAMYAGMLPGSFNPLHSDTTALDGTPNHEDEETEFSALIYLNDCSIDFTGGQIRFPKQDLIIAPSKGLVVFFEGNNEYPHEVFKVESGYRETLVLFLGRKGNVSDRVLFRDEHAGVKQ